MSWKPGRGAGCGFDDAMRREEKYRNELNMLMNTPNATVKAVSKVYYHLLVALRDQRTYFGGNHPVQFGVLLPYEWTEKMKKHRESCYKPLQRYIQE